jgi:hypothetical protein
MANPKVIQNYSNHRRTYPLYHLVFAPLSVIAFIVLFIQAFTAVVAKEDVFLTIVVAILAFMILLLGLFVRGFATNVQDRAIRAEESLRHYILTGNPIHPKLTLSQIIALRFASDEELQGMSLRAVNENLSSEMIKKAIHTWRSDHHRV